MAQLTVGGKDVLGRVAFGLSLIVVFTSLLDLLVNRLLIRAGPETLSHLDIPGIFEIAVVGRISFTLEQLTVFAILACAVIVLLRERSASSGSLAVLIVPQAVIAALLYLPLPVEFVWALGVVLLPVTAVVILALIARRFSRGPLGARLTGERIFLVSLALTFLLATYYRASVIVSSVDVGSLPLQIAAYTGAVYMVMATAVVAFVRPDRPQSRVQDKCT